MVNWANLLTFARIAFIPIFIAVLYLPIPFRERVAAVVFCILAATDAIDGYLARRLKTVSRFGAILDPLADKLLVLSALIFLIGRGVPAWMAWVIIAREFSVVGLRLLVAPKTVIAPSLLGKLKTAAEMVGIVFVLLGFWLAWWVLLAAVVLSVVSALQYFWRVRKAVKI